MAEKKEGYKVIGSFKIVAPGKSGKPGGGINPVADKEMPPEQMIGTSMKDIKTKIKGAFKNL
ncbi:MAG: hypothetical protein PHG00_16705 [Methylococcales bacterium]|nr:hypothetical protein [Methylococcales bacterium]